MDHEEDIVPPPYMLEDAAAPTGNAFSLRVPVASFDSTHSFGLHLGRAPQIRSGLFVGRDAELEFLRGRLLPGSSTRNVVAIAAVGGVGKTQLAINFAELNHQSYTSVFWLNAKDESTLKQEFAALAGVVLDLGLSNTVTAVDEGHAMKQVIQWFSLPRNDRWLLIFDNYDDPKWSGLKSSTGYDIRTYFPPRNHGSILITTRSQRLTFAERLRLNKIERLSQSLEILSNRSGRDLANDPDAIELAKRLDGFPLALTTAGAYLSQSTGDQSVREYLNAYDRQWDELEEAAETLQEYGIGDDDEGRTLFSTWELSLEQVRQQNAHAAEMLRFLAFFGNSGITFELFRATRDRKHDYRLTWLNDLTKSTIMFHKAMAKLHDYSLVEHSNNAYSLHPCVHDWTLHSLNSTVELSYYWDAMLCVAANVKENSAKNYWQNNQGLLQHVTQLWRIRTKNASIGNASDEEQAYSIQWIGILWSQRGNYDRAKALLLSALASYEELVGEFDKRTLDVVQELALIYSGAADYSVAQQLYQRALEGYEKIQEPKATPRLYHNISLLFLKQGKLAEAEESLRKALAGYESIMGLEAAQTLYTAGALASVLVRQGKFSEADDLSQAAANGLNRALGSDHPLTLDAIETRANVYFAQEQREQAEHLYRQVLDSRERILGPDHENTLSAAMNLGNVYAKQKKFDELINLSEIWGEKEKTLYGTLGRAFLREGDEAKAWTAYAIALRPDNGVTPSPYMGWCDVCQTQQEEDVYITLAMGHFICLQCDDVDLCRTCYENHQAREHILDSCVGHRFFELPSQRPAA